MASAFSSAFSSPACSAPSTPKWRPQSLDIQRATATPQGNFYALSTSPSGLASDLGMWFADLRQEAQKSSAPQGTATQLNQQPQVSRFSSLFQKLWS